MRDMRQIRAATFAAGVVIAGLIAGCGQGDGDADVSAQAEDALPRDLALGFVVAGDEAGWVAGVGGGQSVERLWRLTPDGAATEVAELPDLVSPGGAALDDDQVAVVGIRCAGEGDPAEACGAWGIDVLVINADGETTRVALFEEDTALGDGDGLTIAGSTGQSVWVSTKRGVFEVSADGEVMQRVPSSDRGGECVIDGALYRIVGPEPPTDSTQGSSPPVTTGNADQLAADSRPIEIQRLDGDVFTPLPGSSRDLGIRATLHCTDSAVEAGQSTGELTDRWTPTQGWQATRGVPAPAMPSRTGVSALFALNPNGTVLERGQDGAFNPVGIQLPVLSGPGEMPASLSADRSLSMVVACTTRSTNQTDTETVCQTAPAG